MKSYFNEKVEVSGVQSKILRSWQHEISVVFGRLSCLLFLVDKQGFEVRFAQYLDWDLRHRLEDFYKVIEDFVP